MNGAVLPRITAALRDAGIAAYTEFERCTQPIPDAGCFVTVGTEQFKMLPPVQDGDNTALPVTLTLRLRLHAAPAQGTEALDTLRDRVMAALLCSRDPLLSVTGCEALAYQPQNGRLVAELHLSLDGLLRTTDEEV